MSKIHRLKYDGYKVGERLLDGVYFGVEIKVDESDYEILKIAPWDNSDDGYLEQINLVHFEKLIRKDLEELLSSISEFYKENGSTFEEDIQLFEDEREEYGFPLDTPGIQFLMEI